MQVNAINNSDVNFGHKLPSKKTYRAMQGYYELINDKGSAIEYKMLHHDAMARRHYINYKNAESKLLELAETGEGISKIGYISTLVKLRLKAMYERAASILYYYG